MKLINNILSINQYYKSDSLNNINREIQKIMEYSRKKAQLNKK